MRHRRTSVRGRVAGVLHYGTHRGARVLGPSAGIEWRRRRNGRVRERTPMSVREMARLDRELATVLGARPRDPAACTDVLERAAFACRTDPIAAETWVEAELLDELVDCYEALGRVDEAITVMRRALQVGWAGQPDGRCRIAELLIRHRPSGCPAH